MFVVTVTFEIEDAKIAQFIPLMLAQSRNSLEFEEGCLQFDVCRSREAPNRVFLYEVYTSEAAFQDHLASAHFKTFDRAVSSFVVEKDIKTWTRA